VAEADPQARIKRAQVIAAGLARGAIRRAAGGRPDETILAAKLAEARKRRKKP
jgi:hypothetical protein